MKTSYLRYVESTATYLTGWKEANIHNITLIQLAIQPSSYSNSTLQLIGELAPSQPNDSSSCKKRSHNCGNNSKFNRGCIRLWCCSRLPSGFVGRWRRRRLMNFVSRILIWHGWHVWHKRGVIPVDDVFVL